MSVFNVNSNNKTANVFLDDGGIGIARYDDVKYPILKRISKNMKGFYWSPEEIDVNKDRMDFKRMKPHEQEIYTRSLLRVILLDSVQGRAPAEIFNPLVSLPEMENLITTWTFFENIHSESYTYIIQNVYPNPSEIFDRLSEDSHIMACANDISKYYDDLADAMHWYKALGEGTFTIEQNGKKFTKTISKYELKKKIWLALMAVNALEGLRFYSNFAVFFLGGEIGIMEGTAKIIKLICRDENLHLSFTQKLIKSILKKDDPDFVKIELECHDESVEIYESAIRQECEWIDDNYKAGSLIGLNEVLSKNYVYFMGAQRMKAIGLTPSFSAPTTNPLPWMNSWINTGSTQVAPQEVEITSYVVGGVSQDIGQDTFKGFEL